MRDVSVLIPSRHETWLTNTIDDVLAHRKADTEILVGLDGGWAESPIPQHPDVHVVYRPVARGQRGMTNDLAAMSTARYVMKLDAHCSLADGFDVTLIEMAERLGPLVTQVPAQYNFHVFDWVCDSCGARQYQGPVLTGCACGKPAWRMDLVWQRRTGRLTEAWAFDADLVFTYWGGWKDQQLAGGKDPDVIETLSCLGACWFLSRERFHEIGMLDEGHGGWGQMGTEIACKSWLSGGRLVTNRRTWFAHCFRTKQGFGFPYPLSDREREHARHYSHQLWRGNAWPKQTRTLRSLIDQFWGVKGWTEEARAALPMTLPAKPTKGIVYYSDGHVDPEILRACWDHLRTHGLPLVAVCLAPVPGQFTIDDTTWRILLDLPRGPLTMFTQILAGLEAIDTDIVFLCEHDCLYHDSHFDFTPPKAEQFAYNQHVWKVDAETGRTLHYRCNQVSGVCASRELLIQFYRERVATVEREGFSRRLGFEPAIHGRHPILWQSDVPIVDIRHGDNLTQTRWRRDQFRNRRSTPGWTEAEGIPGWGLTTGRFREWLRQVTRREEAA